MCLIIVNRPAPTERVVIYKIVKRYYDLLLAPYNMEFRYQAGWNEAVGDVRIENINELKNNRWVKGEKKIINGGVIHCYHDEIMAKANRVYSFEFVLVGYGESADFVAWGAGGEIAFKKIYIPQEEIAKVLNGV